MWMSKEAYVKMILENKIQLAENAAILDRLEQGQYKLMQSHAALERKFTELDQNLANALRTDGMLGKKLDVLSGQVARLDKKGRK